MKEEKVKVTGLSTNLNPKPTPLIGGTKVYQKDRLPYWYCRIKNGRDEFMYLYFGDLTQDDLIYDKNGKHRKFTTKEQEEFREEVMKALGNMPKECFRWIPIYEPSRDYNNLLQYVLQYVSGEYVLRGVKSYNWEEAFQNYSPENGSRMSSIATYFLLLLRLLKDGFATIEQLADDSKEIGNFWDSENEKHGIEKTGERQFVGLYGFVGNTYKIVKDSESSSGFSILGGSGYSCGCSLAHVIRGNSPDVFENDSVGWLELIK